MGDIAGQEEKDEVQGMRKFFEDRLHEIDARHLWILILFSSFLFLLGNWQLAFTDPVESNYVLTAKEMLESGDYVSPRIYGEYWYDKPAFFYWELIASFQLFGMNEFAARFFPAVFSVLSVLLTYCFGTKVYNEKTGFFAGLILSTAVGYWYIAKAVVTDMSLMFFSNAVLVFFFFAYRNDRWKLCYLSFLFAGLAVLTKGPIGILLPGFILTVFLCVRKEPLKLLKAPWLGGSLLFLLVIGIWYYPMYALHGADFLHGFLGDHNFTRASVSEHPKYDVWYYYTVIFLVGFCPWSFALLYGIKRHWKEFRGRSVEPVTLFLLLWALLITLFYQCMATKYPTYTLPSFMPWALLTAHVLASHELLLKRMVSVMGVLYIALAFLVAVPLCRQNSGKEIGRYLMEELQLGPQDFVGHYGLYMTSVVFYTGHEMYRIVAPSDMAKMSEDERKWDAIRNRMPTVSLEELPKNQDLYLICDKRKYERFRQMLPEGSWTLLKEFSSGMVLKCRLEDEMQRWSGVKR